jgi:hypothetical protein
MNPFGFYGKFKISADLFRDVSMIAPLRQLFGLMVVVRAESLHHCHSAIEYIALSELFDPHELGESIPEYNLYWNGRSWWAMRLNSRLNSFNGTLY